MNNIRVSAFDPHFCFVLNLSTADARKKLEPLEAYVPAVLLTQDQFRDLGEVYYLQVISLITLVY
jgi:hypothetical protein